MKTRITPIAILIAAAFPLAGGIAIQPAAADRPVVIVREDYHDLRAAADEFKAATRELASDLRDVYNRRGWPRDGRSRAIDRLADRAATFEDATDGRQPWAVIRDRYADARDAFVQARDDFDHMPGSREIDHDVDRVRAAMERLRHEYEARGSRPVPPPVVVDRGGSRLDLARQIEAASDELRDRAREIFRHNDGRGPAKVQAEKLDRLDHLAKRGGDLRDVTKNGDGKDVRVSYDKLREVFALADPRGLFSRDVDYKYARLNDLINRFGDTFGRATPARTVIIEHH